MRKQERSADIRMLSADDTLNSVMKEHRAEADIRAAMAAHLAPPGLE